MNPVLRAAAVTTLLGVLSTGSSGPAAALTAKECSTKYQAAKAAGTVGGQGWNDFRKASCAVEAPPAAAAATATKTTAPAPGPVAPTPAAAPPTVAKPAPAPVPTVSAKPAPAALAVTGAAVFPRAVDPKYNDRSAGKARMQTCLDQYNINKAAATGGGNGGLTWIQKGGGYYSECNKRLKG